MDLGIEGRRAAVAAASAGLGLATAKALAQEGVRVAICGRDKSRITEAANEIGDLAYPIVADVSFPDEAQRFVEEAAAALEGTIDILVTNAGGPPKGGLRDIDISEYPRAFGLNLLSTIAMCTAALPAMEDQKWGRVVAISSNTAKQPDPNLILSNTARAGLQGFLKTAATEVAPNGVTINALLPGGHSTQRLLDLVGTGSAEVAKSIPGQRFGTPEEFGAIVAFLCSVHAGFITGTSLVVDGGANKSI